MGSHNQTVRVVTTLLFRQASKTGIHGNHNEEREKDGKVKQMDRECVSWISQSLTAALYADVPLCTLN